MSSAAKTF